MSSRSIDSRRRAGPLRRVGVEGMVAGFGASETLRNLLGSSGGVESGLDFSRSRDAPLNEALRRSDWPLEEEGFALIEGRPELDSVWERDLPNVEGAGTGTVGTAGTLESSPRCCARLCVRERERLSSASSMASTSRRWDGVRGVSVMEGKDVEVGSGGMEDES
jgi:hypothetical protein